MVDWRSNIISVADFLEKNFFDFLILVCVLLLMIMVITLRKYYRSVSRYSSITYSAKEFSVIFRKTLQFYIFLGSFALEAYLIYFILTNPAYELKINIAIILFILFGCGFVQFLSWYHSKTKVLVNDEYCLIIKPDRAHKIRWSDITKIRYANSTYVIYYKDKKKKRKAIFLDNINEIKQLERIIENFTGREIE